MGKKEYTKSESFSPYWVLFQKESLVPQEGSVVGSMGRSMRFDTWVHHRWPWIPYRSIQKAIRRGWILLDEKRASSDLRLENHQEIQVRIHWLHSFPAPDPAAPLPLLWHKKMQEWILYEDDHLIAFNKPQGIACQGGSGQPIHMDRLLQTLPQRMRLVHRLDKDTSGVLVVAKTLACAQGVTENFRRKKIRKTYWALVQGVLPPKGQVIHHLQRKGIKTVVSKDPSALASHTDYRVLQRGRDPHTQKEIAWVSLFPQTGRTHQLRVHLQSLACPILGDVLYGSSFSEPMALHCRTMSFSYAGKNYHLEAPSPPLFSKRVAQFQMHPIS